MINLFKQQPPASFLQVVMVYFFNPIFLLGVGTIFIFAILIACIERSRRQSLNEAFRVSYSLPKLHKDMTRAELAEYDGKAHDGRILVAVNGNIYDITGNLPVAAAIQLSGMILAYPPGTEAWHWANQLEEKYYKVGQLKGYTKTNNQQSVQDDRIFEKLMSRKMDNPYKRSRSIGGHSRTGKTGNESDGEQSC